MNPDELNDAIHFVLEYAPCYSFTTMLRKKTPCCDYENIKIPIGLEEAVRTYLAELSGKKFSELNNSLASELGEGFFIKRNVIVRLLTRLLADGDPRQHKDLLKVALEAQIRHRKHLLGKL